MKQEYAKLILSLQLLGEIERVKICVQILKNVKCYTVTGQTLDLGHCDVVEKGEIVKRWVIGQK